MTEPSMRERLAQAMCADMGFVWEDQAPSPIGLHGNDPSLPAQSDFTDAVDAVLAELEVPTEAMIKAGSKADFGAQDINASVVVLRVFQAMIAEARKS